MDHAAFRLVELEADTDGGKDHPHEAVAEQHPAFRIDDAAQQAEQGKPSLFVVPHRQEDAHQPLARTVDPTGDHRRHGLARVDAHLEGGHEQVVLGTEVVVHQGRVDSSGRGDAAHRRTGEPLGREALTSGGEMVALVSGEPGRRPRRPGDRSVADMPPM